MRGIADERWVFVSAKLLPELALLSQLQLLSDPIIEFAECLHSKAAYILSWDEIRRRARSESDVFCSFIRSDFHSPQRYGFDGT